MADVATGGELLAVAGPRAATGGAALLLLHGRGEYPGQVLDPWSAVDLDWGLVALRAGFRIGPGAYRWFDYLDGTEFAVEPDEERRSFDALVGLLAARRAAEPHRPVRLFGHSQGGMMALSVALLRPDLVDGCAVVNARVLPEALARAEGALRLAGMPVFVAHAVGDEVVPVAHGRRTRELLVRAGADVAYREYPGGHELTAEVVADAAGWLPAAVGAPR